MKNLVGACALVVVAVAIACGGKEDTTDGGADAALDVANANDTGDGAMCTYEDTRTPSTRACATANDCALVVRDLTCCQAEEDGIRTDAVKSFNDAQTALTSGCPGCGCAAQAVDEQGLKGTSFTVTCDKGVCTSHAQ